MMFSAISHNAINGEGMEEEGGAQGDWEPTHMTSLLQAPPLYEQWAIIK